MKLKVHVIVKGMLLFMLISGCALQSTMVDIEDDTVRLRRHQIQLQQRIERLERDQKSPSLIVKNQQALSAELVAQLGVIEESLRAASGKNSETQHLISKLENRLDSESFRTKELVQRLDALEQKVALFESGKGGTSSNGNLNDSSRRLNAKAEEPKFFAPRDAYNLAYNDYVKGNYNVAILAFDAFIKEYPSSQLVPQAYYWTGESHYGKGVYVSAIDSFKKVIDQYPESEKVSKSLLKTGFSYLELKKPAEGRRYLESVVTRFPNSNEAALARDTLLSLNKARP